MLRCLMFIFIGGHSVTDFDTQSAFNRWWTTDVQTNKASWIQSILYDSRLNQPAIREPNLEIDDLLDTHAMMASFDTQGFRLASVIGR